MNFPHHGSLAKELREVLESRLQKGNLPTTAVCTMTLELGIDIGKVKSVIKLRLRILFPVCASEWGVLGDAIPRQYSEC